MIEPISEWPATRFIEIFEYLHKNEVSHMLPTWSRQVGL
jgi:hypothetical protein